MTILTRSQECSKSVALVPFDQIGPSFFGGVGRGHQFHVAEVPQAGNPGITSIGCREKDIGIEKEPIHIRSATTCEVCDEGPSMG